MSEGFISQYVTLHCTAWPGTRADQIDVHAWTPVTQLPNEQVSVWARVGPLQISFVGFDVDVLAVLNEMAEAVRQAIAERPPVEVVDESADDEFDEYTAVGF